MTWRNAIGHAGMWALGFAIAMFAYSIYYDTSILRDLAWISSYLCYACLAFATTPH